jgi:hypothetical protein
MAHVDKEHLLEGIVRPDRAERVMRRLLEPDMWSGWGIRTLSAGNPAYNPFSYQNGSVWPHDNGIIAMGFKRYGFAREAAMVARDISRAASYFVFHRLPELYAGVKRESGTFPVQYVGANVPQAWAAGSVFHLLRALLGLDADAQQKKLYVDPVLPHWLPEITPHKLRVGRHASTCAFGATAKQPARRCLPLTANWRWNSAVRRRHREQAFAFSGWMPLMATGHAHSNRHYRKQADRLQKKC